MTEKEKDELIKELQAQIEQSNKEKAKKGFNDPYRCKSCNMEVAFTYIVPAIKRTGLCPTCFHEQ